jgi:hypothetical protein
MRKLKLEMEDLAVESFTPAPARPARGTAHAHGDTMRDADTVNRDADTVQLGNGGGATVSVCGGYCTYGGYTDCYPYC